MVVAGADVEADGTGDAVLLGVVHQQVGDADTVEDLVGRLLGGLGHDRLVGLAVDHDLPAAFAQVGPVFGSVMIGRPHSSNWCTVEST